MESPAPLPTASTDPSAPESPSPAGVGEGASIEAPLEAPAPGGVVPSYGSESSIPNGEVIASVVVPEDDAHLVI